MIILEHNQHLMMRVPICPTSPENFKALLYPLDFTKDAGVLLSLPCDPVVTRLFISGVSHCF